MTVLNSQDKVATTHAHIPPPPVSNMSGMRQTSAALPEIIIPEEGDWSLVGTTTTVTKDDTIHFFWFWKAVEEGVAEGEGRPWGPVSVPAGE